MKDTEKKPKRFHSDIDVYKRQVVHLATPYMGFGGVGQSGMGSYHGKKSFDTFSHYKSILKNSSFLDLPVRYPPATARKEQLLRWFLR